MDCDKQFEQDAQAGREDELLHPVEQEVAEPATEGTLFDFMSGYVGTISGTPEALSEDCGQRFTEGLVEKQRQGRL